MSHPLGPDLLATLAPPTSLPLAPAVLAELRAAWAVANGLPREREREPARLALPRLTDLQQLWGVLYAQLRILRKLNLDDRAFLHELWDQQRARGRVCAKHLFDIWLSLNDPPRSVMEIGCRTGLSLVNKLMLHPRADRVFCALFDTWNEWGSPAVVLRNLEHVGVAPGGVHFFNGDSRALVPAFAAGTRGLHFDYVLVDGSHAKPDARIDLVNGLDLVARGGWLVLDDTGPDDGGGKGCDLITVWNDVMEGRRKDFETHHYDAGYGFAVARRRED